LKNKTGAAVIMITHDLGVISEIADNVIVMYAGKIVEEGTKMDVLTDPLHPYTEGLLNAAPRIDRDNEELPVIPGRVPNPAFLPDGCYFRPRCPLAGEVCLRMPEKITIEDKSGGRRGVRCWRYSLEREAAASD
jgi:peptide/nickel transport system ATP-binding protein/oligopeptide transport system ATP-binding protein